MTPEVLVGVFCAFHEADLRSRRVPRVPCSDLLGEDAGQGATSI
jgi:hypothetical protein